MDPNGAASIPIRTFFDPATARRLQLYANEVGRSRSSAVRFLVAKALREYERERDELEARR